MSAYNDGMKGRLAHESAPADDLHQNKHMPSMDKIRAAIENCMCPFCGRGPFKSTAMHVNAVHDFDRHKLREIAGMTTNESLASPEYSAHMAGVAKRTNAIGNTGAYVNALRGGRRPMKMTAAGSEKISRTMKATNDRLTPEQRSAKQSEHARKQTPESRAKQAASLALYHRAHPPTDERKAKMLAALNTPEAKANLAAAAARRRMPCGTAAAYNRGCRCEPCRAAKKATR